MANFDYWKSALSGAPLPVSADHPQPGFYKLRVGKGQPYLPVAIWMGKDGEMRCKLADNMVDPMDYWTWCADKPVTKEDAKAAFETGHWPGDVGVPAAIGDNSGDLSLMEEIQDYMATAREWGETPRVDGIDKETADKAANYATHLGTLVSNLDKERKEKVAPHLEAQREVNGRYNPVIEEAKALVKRLKQITGVWLRAEEDKRKKELAATNIAQEEVAKVKAGGQRGRRVGLRTVIKYECEDAARVLAWAIENRPENMQSKAIDLAEIAMKNGADIPGMKRVETKEAV